MPRFPTVSPLDTPTLDAVAAALQPCVSSLHGLYAAAKVAHWNVRGANFDPLHNLFGEVADAAAKHEDAIAELIPQMGALVEPPGEMPEVDGAPDGVALCSSLADIIREDRMREQVALSRERMAKERTPMWFWLSSDDALNMVRD